MPPGALRSRMTFPTPIPAHLARPQTDRTYLVFLPDHGGWHAAEWWTVECPEGRWVLAWDVSVELPAPSHVMDAPPDALDASGTMQWIRTERETAGRA